MFFIGQDHIMPQLGDLLAYTRTNKDSATILFRGPSGYGKTELAKRCCNFLVGRNYTSQLGDSVRIDRNVWVHFIDEIHLMENPEILYPIIDSNRYVFIFATNFDSILPEALINRCTNFIFTEYSDRDLMDIVQFHSRLQLSPIVLKHLIDVSGRNPRVLIKTFVKSLEIRYSRREEELLIKPDEELIKEIDELHGIINGLDRISRQYLSVLQNLGGRASINLIVSTLRLDVNTIKYTVEPILLNKNLIRITNRGRELC